MAVTISGGQRQGQRSWGGVEALTQTTTTAEQTISIYKPVTTIAGSTSTNGAPTNRFVVPAGNEGDEKFIFMTSTGSTWIRFGGATTDLLATGGRHYINVATATGAAIDALGVLSGSSTGAFVLTTANSFLQAIYMNGGWWLRGGLATIGTVT